MISIVDIQIPRSIFKLPPTQCAECMGDWTNSNGDCNTATDNPLLAENFCGSLQKFEDFPAIAREF